MKATVNGVLRDLPEGMTVAALLQDIGAVPTGIAVAHNERVVRRGDYGTHALAEGDRIEIIKAVAGG